MWLKSFIYFLPSSTVSEQAPRKCLSTNIYLFYVSDTFVCFSGGGRRCGITLCTFHIIPSTSHFAYVNHSWKQIKKCSLTRSLLGLLINWRKIFHSQMKLEQGLGWIRFWYSRFRWIFLNLILKRNLNCVLSTSSANQDILRSSSSLIMNKTWCIDNKQPPDIVGCIPLRLIFVEIHHSASK